MNVPLLPGSVVWVDLNPTLGREQAGRRPAVIVASSGYLEAVTELAIVVPATTTDRGWPQHVELTGPGLTLPRPTYAMTEQPRTVSRQRIASAAGAVDSRCLASIRRWLSDFLHDDLSSR
ncbi:MULTISPECIES: type II toxin-antitoxin system PemK/MazF family toxin [Mycolicibacterium]|uniref:Growth inhibitor n=1 Tax=Mycolicibacterium gilvum TaxID=1804 RepID=A0A379MQ34_9MYCO|nr:MULTISPECIES: type II toxin-antitoxin system PemK/MazF family toxin [Mycolicibacterium]MBU8813371.1 type II toxin-antitoxin system PemK/MazF family toxin [Mycolicibacterium goodii]MCV7059300.1 type II toxin-antitoxin system PemK/MazF family toxin [Mycolicibacterium gilvum]SUE32732.1 growth inhibitor [Mycolicibacterium gilvum]